MKNKIKEIARRIEPELIKIRQELHRYPELGIELPKTHEIISRELHKIPGLEIYEHMAGGSGLVGILRGKCEKGKTILLRADIDALPVEELYDCSYKSEYPGCMHACGHDGHAAWLIGAAKILAELKEEWNGCIKFVFQPGEEIGLGAQTLIEEEHILENPNVDMAFAAHGWPSVISGQIGIARRYAFGCVGSFRVKITGKKGHASWPEETIDPISAANEIYQHMPSVLTRKISGTEPKVFSVTYMIAGDPKVRNVIPQSCEFGGTIRATNSKVLKQIGEELRKETEAVCRVAGAEYELEINTNGKSVENDSVLLEGVVKTSSEILGKENVYIIEKDHLGGENFAEYSSRVPSVYLFIGIKPKEEEIPGLHSPEYRFDDNVLAGASATFALLGYNGCMGILKGED